jgi:hypothetical protein
MANYNKYAGALYEWNKLLKDSLAPVVYSSFAHLYVESIKYAERKAEEKMQRVDHYKVFRVVLEDVPNWNNKVISEYVNQLTAKIPKLQSILKSICVAMIYVLSCVRMNNKNDQELNATIPSIETFTHEVYTLCAQEFAEDVHLFDHQESIEIKRRKKKIAFKIIKESIETAVRTLLKPENILDDYLNEIMKEKEFKPSPEEIAPPAATITPPQSPPKPDLPIPIAEHNTDSEAEAELKKEDIKKAEEMNNTIDEIEDKIEQQTVEEPASSSSDTEENETLEKTIRIPDNMLEFVPSDKPLDEDSEDEDTVI